MFHQPFLVIRHFFSGTKFMNLANCIVWCSFSQNAQVVTQRWSFSPRFVGACVAKQPSSHWRGHRVTGFPILPRGKLPELKWCLGIIVLLPRCNHASTSYLQRICIHSMEYACVWYTSRSSFVPVHICLIQDVTSSVHIQNPKAGLSCVGFLPAKLTCSDEIVMTCSDDMFLRKQGDLLFEIPVVVRKPLTTCSCEAGGDPALTTDFGCQRRWLGRWLGQVVVYSDGFFCKPFLGEVGD